MKYGALVQRWRSLTTLSAMFFRCSKISFAYSEESTPPNGSRLSCGRPARRRKAAERSPCPARDTNTPLPVKRSPPVSFKRLLGAAMRRRLHLLPETIDLWVRKVVEHKMSVPSREES